MDTAHLKLFLALAKLGSITQTAESIGCTKSSLSKRIAQVEEEVGVQLFSHKRNHIEITPAGNHFLEMAQKIVSLEGMIQQEVCRRTLPEQQTNVITIGTPQYIAPFSIIESIGAFSAIYPHIKIKFLEYPRTTKLEEMFSAGQINMAFVRDHHDFENGYEKVILLHDHLKIVLSKNDLLAKKGSVRLSELEQHAFYLLTNQRPYTQFMDLCQEAGITPQIAGRFSNADTLMNLAAMGLGASCIIESLVMRYKASERVALLDIDPPAYCDFLLIYPKDKPLLPEAKLFLDYLTSAVITEDGDEDHAN